jgi:hypothetical protein
LLGIVFAHHGRMNDADAAFRAAQALPANARADMPQKEIDTARELAPLDARLPAILRGDDEVAGAKQRLQVAEILYYRRMYATALRWAGDAFAAEPALLDDLEMCYRSNAAGYAALAGCGRGIDAAAGDAERARWRQQALDWLSADLRARSNAAADRPGGRAECAESLREVLQHTDFAGVRGEDGLAKLPESERDGWRKHWAAVAAAQAKAGGSDAPRETPAKKP